MKDFKTEDLKTKEIITNFIKVALSELNPLKQIINNQNYNYSQEAKDLLNLFPLNVKSYNYNNIKLIIKQYFEDYFLAHLEDKIIKELSNRIITYINYLEIYLLFNNNNLETLNKQLIYKIHNYFIVTFKTNQILINNKFYKYLNEENQIEDMIYHLNSFINNNEYIYIQYYNSHNEIPFLTQNSYIYVINNQTKYEDIPYQEDIELVFNNKDLINLKK